MVYFLQPMHCKVYYHPLFKQILISYQNVFSLIGSGTSKGMIIQRFPEKDWKDTPFIDGIEWVITIQIYYNTIDKLKYLFYLMLGI